MVSTSGSQILLIGLMLIGIFAWIKPLQKSHQNCPLELNPPPILNTSNFSQENVKETLTKWGGKLKDVFAGKNLNPSCKVVTYGNDWGRHHLCETNMGKPCFFYSFGISYDFSFDVDVHNSMGCKGIGFDPTVSLCLRVFYSFLWGQKLWIQRILPNFCWSLRSRPFAKSINMT